MIPAEIVDEFSDQIGGRLREAREEAGLSVEDVQFRTRIPKSVIEALEAGDFSVFSSPTYAKSFLSQYSGFVNVEAALWLDALEPVSFISGDNVTPLWKTADPKSEERVSASPESGGWFPTLILFSVTGGLLFAAIKGYEFFETRSENESKAAPVKKEEVAPVQKPSPAESGPKVAENPKPFAHAPTDDPVSPPPRAIIVR